MTTPPERWLLDTNIWVFGLRRDEAFPNCAQLLDRIGSFNVLIPLQVLKELNLNLTEDEISDFYNLINRQPERVEQQIVNATEALARLPAIEDRHPRN